MKRKPRETDAAASAQDAPPPRRAAWAVVSIGVHALLVGFAVQAFVETPAVALEQGNPPISAVFVSLPSNAPPPPEPPPLAETPPVLTTQAEAPIVPQEVERPILPEIEPPPPEEPPPVPPMEPPPLPEPTEIPPDAPLLQAQTPAPMRPDETVEAPPFKQALGGSDVTPVPEAVFQPPPPYPPAALRRGLEGRVKLAVYLYPTGRPQRVEIAESSGYTFFDRAALRTVRDQWRFNGSSSTPVFVTITFRLCDR
jgi:protein TonB